MMEKEYRVMDLHGNTTKFSLLKGRWPPKRVVEKQRVHCIYKKKNWYCGQLLIGWLNNYTVTFWDFFQSLLEMTNKMESLQKDQDSLQALQNQVLGSFLHILGPTNTVGEIIENT